MTRKSRPDKARPTATLEPARPGRSSPEVAKNLVHFSPRHPMLVDVRLASFGVHVEAKPHALSHTTKQSSGTATSKETLIYRWCRRCWSLSYELRDETTDVHRI